MLEVKVKLKKSKYSIFINNDIISQAGQFINSILPAKEHKKVFIITDKNVNGFSYLQKINDSLKKFEYECINIILEPGEKSKNFDTYERTANYILQNKINRSDFLIALGGGVIGDLTGFLASTLLRGVPFIQIPTTLLSQVDSSVGGKNGIDSNFGKNLIGTFYQPKLVLIDPLTLKTLPKRELKSGYAEVLKYSLIMNKNFFNYLQKHGNDCLNLNFDVCKYVIYKSCKFKASIVEKDELETKGLRAILNFGHTFGHVYEKITNYDTEKIVHGEAVGLGIIQASMLSKNLGLCSQMDLDLIINHFKSLNLFSFNDLKKLNEFKKNVNIDDFIEIMRSDKKASYGKLNVVLIYKIGESSLKKDISIKDIKNILEQTLL